MTGGCVVEWGAIGGTSLLQGAIGGASLLQAKTSKLWITQVPRSTKSHWDGKGWALKVCLCVASCSRVPVGSLLVCLWPVSELEVQGDGG